jgi:hypothetical protein
MSVTARIPKAALCLWYNHDAEDAAKFYARTFPGSSVGAVWRAPGGYPDGKEGDALVVEFTVLGVPCIGLNGGQESLMWLVQGQVGPFVADHPEGADRSAGQGRRRRQAGFRGNDDHEENRRCRDRSLGARRCVS